MDDAELVARCRIGDPDSFGQLVLRHEGAMLALARAFFASTADAEDVAQEAFLKAFRMVGQLQDDRCFPGWLARIVVNTCRDILRTRSDRVSLAEFSSSAQLRPRVFHEELTPASLAGRNEEAELVRTAVGRLPEDQRMVVMLRYSEHLSYQEIADYLDITPTIVRGRLHRAKQALHEALLALQGVGRS